MVRLGALDDASGVAPLFGFAAPLLDELGHALAADILGKFEAAAPEILGGERPGFIDDIDQDRGAERGQGLAAHRVVHEVLGPAPGGLFKFFRVGQGYCFGAPIIHHQGLELLGAHQGPQAAPARGPARTALGIGEVNGGPGQALFSGLADAHDPNTPAEALP